MTAGKGISLILPSVTKTAAFAFQACPVRKSYCSSRHAVRSRTTTTGKEEPDAFFLPETISSCFSLFDILAQYTGRRRSFAREPNRMADHIPGVSGECRRVPKRASIDSRDRIQERAKLPSPYIGIAGRATRGRNKAGAMGHAAAGGITSLRVK